MFLLGILAQIMNMIHSHGFSCIPKGEVNLIFGFLRQDERFSPKC